MTEVDAQLLATIHGRVGQTVCAGKYSIEGVLGIGGMAAVYSGVHRNGRRVAMKLLHPELSRRSDVKKRFLREGQAANKVEHPGVVAVIDDDVTEDGTAFLVMERLEGKSLEQVWEDAGRRLPVRVVLAIARELCEVLAVAHRVGIVHRDLKPENLFLTHDAQLKVLDFGLAHLRDAARPKETHTGMVFGTPAFMPPEQASGQTSQIDPRTDIWAIGATMFTLLSGELVHRGETGQHFVMLSATQPARSLSAAMPDAPPMLVDVVDRALAYEKERRWQSADAMREAIIGVSATLVGDAEIPLMTPTAIAERSSARVLPQTHEAGPAHAVEETTKRRDAAPTVEDTIDESSSEETEVRAPKAFDLDATDAPTELSGRPAPSGGRSDTPTEQTTRDARFTPVRSPLDSASPERDRTRRGSWSDLRKAVESLRDDDDAPTRHKTAVVDAEPVQDQTALLATHFRPSSRKILQAATPEGPGGLSFTPGHRGKRAALLTLTGNPKAAKLPARSSARAPYVPVLVAAAFSALLPLAYFVSRRSGAAAMVDASSTTALPSAIATAPPRTTAMIVAPVEGGTIVQASAAPSTLPSRPESAVIVPDSPYAPAAPALPANPYGPDIADVAAPPRWPPPSPKAAASGVTQPIRKSNCTPPYAVDASGKLHWKEECLATSKPLSERR